MSFASLITFSVINYLTCNIFIKKQASKGAKVVTLANSSKNTRIAMQKTTNAAIVAKNGNRKKAIAAEMRQKVAEAAKEKADSLKLADAGQSETTANQGLSHSHLMQNAQATFKQKQKCMSPMDTYEMSDRGESDSESEDESEFEEKSSKKVRLKSMMIYVNNSLVGTHHLMLLCTGFYFITL